MSPQVEKLDSIFGHAIEIENAEERNHYLQSVCGSDTELHNRVDQLVRNYFRAGDFLQQPVAQLDAAELSGIENSVDDLIGATIGCYVIREKIGEGGMGMVYVAEQTQPVQRNVALKLIRPGMASKEVLARFQAERQALAIMDHPHVARVFDGGLTDGGQPYFAMELVRGSRVTEYCDQNQRGIRDRLILFQQICSAVHHAHQKGIIHRDLKPSNILITEVDGAPVPKVIDFGIAKAIDQKLADQTIHTQSSQLLGTPQYMSPEQVGGGHDIDTRSDVYSLGIVLYELLSGKTPFDGDTLRKSDDLEIRRIVREQQPRRPSTLVTTLDAGTRSTIAARRRLDANHLAKSLRGELDWLVMKAIEKDRERRYESVSALSEDVQRYLANQPVLARPPGIGYRLRKFTQRNRLLVASCAAILLAVALGLGFAVSGYRAAQWEANQNRQLISLLRSMFQSGWGHEMSLGDRTLREAVDGLVDRVDERFGDTPALEIEARRIFGEAYFSFGQRDKSRKQMEKALKLAEQASGPRSLLVGNICADIAYQLMETYGSLDNEKTARVFARRAVEIFELHGVENLKKAHALFVLGMGMQSEIDRRKEAIGYARRAHDLRLKLLGPHDRDRIWAYWDLGLTISRMHDDRNEEVNELMRKTVEISQQFMPDRPGTAAGAYMAQAQCFLRQGDYVRAIRGFEYARQVFRQAGIDQEVATSRNYLQLAEIYHALHRHTEAAEVLGELRALAREHGRPDWFAQCDFVEGWGEFLREDFPAAETKLQSALVEGRKHLSSDHNVLPFAMYYLARSLDEQEKRGEANDKYEEFRHWQERALAVIPNHELVRLGYALVLLHTGEIANAVEHIEVGLKWNEKWPFFRYQPHLYLAEAVAEDAMGDPEGAIRSLELGLRKLDKNRFLATTALQGPRTRRELENLLAQILVEEKRPEEAYRILQNGVEQCRRALPHDDPLDADHLPVALAQLRYGEFLLQHHSNPKDLQQAEELLAVAYRELLDNREAARVTVGRAKKKLQECRSRSN